MTNEEAIKCIDDVLFSDYLYDVTLGYQLTSDDLEWLEKSKAALEKQIPKRPINDALYWAICPACGGSVSKNNVREYVVEEGTSYCEHCGQALDWSDTE